MDESLLAKADQAYEVRDWRAAARDYLAAVQGSEAPGTGRAYHMAGNALMKLRRHTDAATVYGHGVADTSYEKHATVLTNLGSALAADGRLSDAIAAFDGALGAGGDTPWKAQQGKAGALFDMGRFEEAALAYREAAWVEGNPDPGPALNNLGLSYMSLHRPEEAVEAFKAAVATEGYAARGRASANLGLAYSEMGFHEEAVRAFETAHDVFSYALKGAAVPAYEKSLAVAGAAPEIETVEGWATGELPTIADAATAGTDDDDPDADAFFKMSEDEMRERGRASQKEERRQKVTGRGLFMRLGLTAIGIVAIAAVFIGAWYLGLGYPTQTTVVSGMIDAYRAGTDVLPYWVAVPPSDVKQEMRMLPSRFKSYRVDGVTGGPDLSVAKVTIRLDPSGAQSYAVSLAREGVGWKVNGISNQWRSTTDGP